MTAFTLHTISKPWHNDVLTAINRCMMYKPTQICNCKKYFMSPFILCINISCNYLVSSAKDVREYWWQHLHFIQYLNHGTDTIQAQDFKIMMHKPLVLIHSLCLYPCPVGMVIFENSWLTYFSTGKPMLKLPMHAVCVYNTTKKCAMWLLTHCCNTQDHNRKDAELWTWANNSVVYLKDLPCPRRNFFTKSSKDKLTSGLEKLFTNDEYTNHTLWVRGSWTVQKVAWHEVYTMTGKILTAFKTTHQCST